MHLPISDGGYFTTGTTDERLEMLYLYLAHKGSNGDAIRRAVRVEHLEYMIAHRETIVSGGSFTDDQDAWGGMLLVLQCADRDAALRWIAAEPYYRFGVFSRHQLDPFRQLIPESAEGLLKRELETERGLAGDRVETVHPT